MSNGDSQSQPQSADLEKAVLGALLNDSDAIVRISDKLRAEDFYDSRHQYIFDAILKLYQKNRKIDVLTVSNQLKSDGVLDEVDGSGYITELASSVHTSTAHVEDYAEIIFEKSVRRRLIKAAADMGERSGDDKLGLQELVEGAEKSLFDVSTRHVKQDLFSVESILTESFERLDELHKDKSKMRGVSTGFDQLDNKLAGLQKSDLIVLAARPAMGKSTLAMNIAHHVGVKEQEAVLVFSLEMSKEQLVDRLLAAEAGINAWNLRTGNLSDEDFEKLSEAMGTLSEAPIFIDDTPATTVMEIRTKARREQHKRPLGLIIVDYLQLMSGSVTSSDNRVQEISEISRGLKAIARELNVPVLALSQLSRSVESRSPQIPQLADLRESGSIEQDADVVLFIYREEYYNPETERQHLADIFIKKHRNGPTGQLELYFHDDRLLFTSIDTRHAAVEDVFDSVQS